MKLYESMIPSQLQATRSEYKLFKLSIFRGCIKQEIHCQKYINYLENKQTEKRRKFAEDKAKKKVKAKKEAKGKEAPKNAGNSRKQKVGEKEKLQREQKLVERNDMTVPKRKKRKVFRK
eukprot:2209942-Ditylum_brightwellii.AAC.1